MNLTKKIIAYIKITRPLNVIITFLVVVVTILISEKNRTELIVVILASLSAALTAAAGNIVNDIYDIDTDRVSHPNRVLVVSSLSTKEAWFEYFFINLIAAFIVAALSPILLIFVLFTAFLLFIYSYQLKKLPLFGNIIIAIITGLAFIYGGFAAGYPEVAVVPAVFAFLINLIREIVKDMQDIAGDSKLNYKSFPILFGINASKRLIIYISLGLILFTLYPFLTQLYKIEYFIFVMLIVNPVLVLCLKYLFDKHKENNLDIVSKLLKLDMVLGLIAIYLGK
jgi:4-hydroxybenzoate polyprenyltransferase